MRAVLTVIGKDMVGILAGVSGICARSGVNITEVSQSIMQELFAMIMMVDITESSVPFDEFRKRLEEYGDNNALSIRVMHEDIFNSMHRV
ncbi:MAG: ACT domain-containing protein [Clostridiales bacterium]|nr:ACT domain-containing protein [Clostridiales bacterium]